MVSLPDIFKHDTKFIALPAFIWKYSFIINFLIFDICWMRFPIQVSLRVILTFPISHNEKLYHWMLPPKNSSTIVSLHIQYWAMSIYTSMQEHSFEHFANEGHCSFLEDVTITFIDKTDPKDPNWREHYWRHVFQTMVPLDLNVEDD